MMENYNELDELLDGLVEIIESLPEPTVRIINPHRFREMLHAMQNLRILLASNHMEGDVQYRIDEQFLLGAISVELSDLSVTTVPLLMVTIADADAVELYPLTNGQIRLDITFQGVLSAVC